MVLIKANSFEIVEVSHNYKNVRSANALRESEKSIVDVVECAKLSMEHADQST